MTDDKIGRADLHRANREREWDDVIDSTAIIEDDGRSENETMFYPDENIDSVSTERREQYERMHRINSGVRVNAGNRRGTNRAAGRQHTAYLFCSQMEMTPYQTERVIHVLDDVHVNKFGHYSAEQIILAIMVAIARADTRFIEDEAPFHDLMESVNVSPLQLRRLRKMLNDDNKWKHEESRL